MLSVARTHQVGYRVIRSARDTTPSTTEGIDFPIHALALNAMGVHLLDYLQLEDLVTACERESRWEFLFLAAPLRLFAGGAD